MIYNKLKRFWSRQDWSNRWIHHPICQLSPKSVELNWHIFTRQVALCQK